MFFVLSKLLNVLLSPFIWALLLLLLGRFVNRGLRRRLQVASVGLLLLFSNGFLFQKAVGLWEIPTIAPDELSRNYRTVVVLGGMASENQHTGLPRFGRSADRLFQGLWLLHRGVVDTLIISGGRGELFGDQVSEGVLLKRYLKEVDGLNDRILIESSSRNTRENASYTSKLFERRGLQKSIVLVTSAFHMRRAQACFQKAGFNVEVYPADSLSDVRPPSWRDFLVPSAAVMSQWQVLFQEWIGFGAYWLNDYL